MTKKSNIFKARLSKDLTKKHNTRNIPVRKGDRVKVVRGTYKGTLGKIERIELKKERIFVVYKGKRS